MNQTNSYRISSLVKRNPNGLAIFGLILIGVLFHSSIVFQTRIPLDMDSLLFFYPLRVIHDDPNVGYWNPYMFCGFPRDANPQAQILYFPNAIIWFLPSGLSYSFLLTGHFLLGGLLLYGMLRAMGLTPASGFFGALVFLVSTYWRCKITNLGLLEGISWVPGVLWFYVLSLERRQRVFAMVSALLLAMVILAGVPHTVIYTTLLLLCITLGYGIFQRQWINEILTFCATFLFAILLTCGMWLPAMMYAPEAIRGTLSLSEALAGSLSWGEIGKTFLGGLSQPEISRCDPWEGTCYIGITALLFVPWGWKQTPHRWRYGLSVASLLALIFTLGKQGFLFSFLFEYVPGWDRINMPNRSLLMAALSLSVFAGFGFQAWFKKETYSSKKTIFILFLSLAALILFAIPALRNPWVWNVMLHSAMTRTFYPESITPDYWAVLNFFWWSGLTGLLIAAYQRKWLRRELLLIILTLFVVVQAVQYSQRLFLQTTGEDYFQTPQLVQQVQSRVEKDGFFRTMGYAPTMDTSDDVRVRWIKPVMMQRLPEVYSLYDIHGYDPMAPKHYADLLRSWAGQSPTTNPDRMIRVNQLPKRLLDLLGVRYVIGNPNAELIFSGRKDDTGPCSLVCPVDESKNVKKIRIRWLMAGAAAVQQGISVGQVNIMNGTQTVKSFPVRAGVEIANYIIDPPRYPANHRPVQEYRWFPIPSQEGYFRVRQYWTSFSLDQPEEMDQIEIVFTRKKARFSVFSIEVFHPNIPGLTLVEEGNEFSLYENKDAFPPAYLTRNWSTYDEFKDIIQGLERYFSDESIPVFLSPENTILAEKSPIEPEPTKETLVEFTRTHSDRYSIHLQATYDGVLVITENYSPNWTAIVDGEPTKVMRANHAFMAIPMTRGEHSVIIKYVPYWFRYGCLVSGVTLIFLIFLLAMNKRNFSSTKPS